MPGSLKVLNSLLGNGEPSTLPVRAKGMQVDNKVNVFPLRDAPLNKYTLNTGGAKSKLW